MKKIAYLILLTLTSCYVDQTKEAQDYYLESMKPKPYTLKEKKFISELRKRDFFKVELYNPRLGYNICNSYIVYLHSNSIYNSKENDSLTHLSEELAKHLYSNVLEDSTIVAISRIEVEFNFKSQKYKTVSIRRTIGKNWLEKEFGYKIKDFGNEYYSKVRIYQDSIKKD